MQLEELGFDHLVPFIGMVRDYESNDPQGFARHFPTDEKWDAGAFRRFVQNCEKERMDWRPGPNKLSRTTYVLRDSAGEICGHGVMCFPLDETSLHEGGNLRFGSPPSKRGEMNEVHTLNRMLFEAVRAGLARVLVTCDEGDEVQLRAIEMNRGELENIVPSLNDPHRKIRRYWIRFR